MRFVSLFAGVGGFDLGLERSGHTSIGQVEIDKHARAALERHWPNVPKHDDVTTAIDWADEIGLTGTVDLVAGGFPCQDLSVAGRRAGLDGKRSGLFFDALAFATHVQAKTILLENVPGLLSSNQGRDFGAVLSALADAGYSNIEWRVLNSQFFGVPQRRRRVFIVANTGREPFRTILSEPKSSTRNSSSSDQQGQEIARDVERSFSSDGSRAGNFELYDFPDSEVAPSLNALRARDTMVYGQSGYGDYDLGVKTLNASMHKRPEDSIVVFSPRYDEAARIHDSEIAPTVATYYGTGGSNMPFVAKAKRVRRLTPTECERLQGFPDGWTEGAAETHRYKQMGNAVTVNVIEWIGSRL
jgi:DNA (cytosine-5)-methyltransferase 1